MRKLLAYIFFGFSLTASAQFAFNNVGNVRVHENANVGFHTTVFNNGSFSAAPSLVGFYDQVATQISGQEEMNLYDAEFFTPAGLFLLNRVNIENNANFILGDIETPFSRADFYLNFLQDAFSTGENNTAKVVGYVAMTNKDEFSFQVGTQSQLRPLILDSNGMNTFASCTYLFENPSSPFSINTSFDRDQKLNSIGEISSQEFWILNGDVESTITLSWNLSSNLGLIANELTDVLIVGWDIALQMWVPLSEPTGIGNLDEGIITSTTFLPNQYGAITFGTIPLPLDTFAANNPTLGDYFISPNNDGVNEGLIFDNLEETGSNMVRIYNKFGQKVFEQQNYTNEFRGRANMGNLIIKQDIGLPEGVYYYTIDLPDEGLAFQGFLFLDR